MIALGIGGFGAEPMIAFWGIAFVMLYVCVVTLIILFCVEPARFNDDHWHWWLQQIFFGWGPILALLGLAVFAMLFQRVIR